MLQDILSVLSGTIVGFTLGLIGGGGSILAVPLLVYVVRIGSTHLAIGTGAVAVAASALINLAGHARAGHVRWACALVFAAAGVIGAFAGAALGKRVDGDLLLALFGLLMVVVGLAMLRRKTGGDAQPRLDRRTAPRLAVSGFVVGGLSGFFGIGGGFLVVPGLIFSTAMPLLNAIGSSLVSVTAFGTATASSYAISGLVDWRIAGLFVVGGVFGGILGTILAKRLAAQRQTLNYVFAGIVIAVGVSIMLQGVRTLWNAGLVS
ncbi:MAG: hypothetical protein CMF74_09920 [Maricaulis sp.]|jgi:uncharacterized membrane protein YfcA|nr:hypothetical protein [Maricaulis sp.]HAQ34721.1 hypothetical protein [Alphaproteobacteria bacterium]